MQDRKTVTINGREIEFNDERNLLEVIRNAGVDIPTFCYHSDLSVYGACRLCLVEVDGSNVLASCSTAPKAGMTIKTETKDIREMRKINIELLLANHNRECPTCVRSSNCSLQDIARRLGVDEVRYNQLSDLELEPIDRSSPSLVRDPNKCILCGDCVRMCSEVQGIGAIDFVNRGAKSQVAPAFGESLCEGECVYCGQCAVVCPTGAITPKQDRDAVWEALLDPTKTVVAQVAPAVRVGLGEYFGLEPGKNSAGKLVSSLRSIGFDQVYDTSFSADLTIFEEATELVERLGSGGVLPMITSCCPGWVKYAETYFPQLLPNLSSCRSPQQMFGSVARKVLPEQLGVDPENLVMVSIMPCTAKKQEAGLDKFKDENGRSDVDFVLTTHEAGRMIKSAGIRFEEIESSAFDMPLGFSTGSGVIFGATGGVMEAALRFAKEKVDGKQAERLEFTALRGLDKIKEAEVEVGGKKLRVAVVHTLAQAGQLADAVANGTAGYDFIEVMACPGGCVSGAGQPINLEEGVSGKRAAGLYKTDRNMQLSKPQENYMVDKIYEEYLGGQAGSHEAHEALHTYYRDRSQLTGATVSVLKGEGDDLLPITVTINARAEKCPGQILLAKLVEYVSANGLANRVDINAVFDANQRVEGTVGITVGDRVLEPCRFTNANCTEEEMVNSKEFHQLTEVINSLLKKVA